MNSSQVNSRITDSIAVLIKVLADTPSEFSRFVYGYFSKVESLDDQENLFIEFSNHLALLVEAKNHVFFELGDISLNKLVGQALGNFVSNPNWVPKNRFAKKFITRLIDYCHSGYYSSAAVDAHPLAIKLGFYSY